MLSIGFNTYSFKVNLASDEQAEQVTEIFGNNNMFMVLFEKGEEDENIAGHREIVSFLENYEDFKNEDGTDRDVTAIYSPVKEYTEQELSDMLRLDSDMVEKLYLFMEKSGQAVTPLEIRQFAAQYMSEGILNIKITPQKLASMTDMKSSFVEMYYTMMDYDTVYDNNVPLIALVTDLQDEEWRQTVRLLCETVLKTDPEPLFELADEIYGQREELAALGFQPRYGARSLRRMLLEYVEEPLAGMIVGEEVCGGDTVSVEFVGGRVALVRRAPAGHPHIA